MLVCVFLCTCCTRDRGCSAHPVFPAPSDQEGKEVSSKPRAYQAARSRRHVSTSLRVKRSNPYFSLRREMDCFASLAMTLREREAVSSSQLSSPAHAGDPVFQRRRW